jgi:hypothetical protein
MSKPNNAETPQIDTLSNETISEIHALILELKETWNVSADVRKIDQQLFNIREVNQRLLKSPTVQDTHAKPLKRVVFRKVRSTGPYLKKRGLSQYLNVNIKKFIDAINGKKQNQLDDLPSLLARFFPDPSQREHFLMSPRPELNEQTPKSFIDSGRSENIRLFLARREREAGVF